MGGEESVGYPVPVGLRATGTHIENERSGVRVDGVVDAAAVPDNSVTDLGDEGTPVPRWRPPVREDIGVSIVV